MYQHTGTRPLQALRNLLQAAKRWGRTHYMHPTVVGICAALVVFSAAMVGEHIAALMYREQEMQEITLHLNAIQARLQTALHRRVSLVEGVRAYVLRDPQEIDAAQFESLAAQLVGSDPAVRMVALAPDSVVSLVYPRRENEAIHGRDLLQGAQQPEMIQRTITTGETVLAGPYSLGQGGTGLIARKAIYVGQESGSRGRYWGLAMVVFDPLPILMEAGLLADTRGIRFSIRGRDGKGEKGELFFGDPLPMNITPLHALVEIPGGTWQLTAQPEHGGRTGSPGSAVILGIGAFLAALAGTLVCGHLRREQDSARLQARSEEADRRRQESDQKYRSLFEHHSDGVAYIGLNGQIVAVNPAVSRLLGYPEEELLGAAYKRHILNWDRLPFGERLERVLNGEAASYELRVRHRDGHVRHLHMTTVPIFAQQQVVGAFEIAKDITHYKQTEEELTTLAYYDAITGLGNRSFFMKKLERALSQSDGQKVRTAVLYMDLDRFKWVNDTYGHETGDRLLEAVASRLRHCVRPGDTLARLAGDEFALLLPHTGWRSAAKVAARILAACQEPLSADGRAVTVVASIGVAVAAPGSSAQEVLRQADLAMYQAKRRGGRGVKLYRAALDAGAPSR